MKTNSKEVLKMINKVKQTITKALTDDVIFFRVVVVLGGIVAPIAFYVEEVLK
jgi:hypothetical protein